MPTQTTEVAAVRREAAQDSPALQANNASTAEEAIAEQLPDARTIMHQRLKMLGSIVLLMQNSPLHRQYTIAELEERFIPSLLHNQFRYYEINGAPVGFLSWAWLDEDTETKFSTGKYELSLDEWKSGESLWFPEFIAPFGHARMMVKDIRTNVFKKGTPAKALRISPEGELTGIAKYRL